MYGAIIRYYRKMRGLTQSDLARVVNVSEKTISSWEVDRTEPKMVYIELLAKALDIPKSELVGEEITPEKLTVKEVALITAYRSASREIRQAVDAVLRLEA